MTLKPDVEQWGEELVDACAWGEEARARALVARLREQPQEARALLEAMLEDPDAQVRQAAVFALGGWGGAEGARRLEQQLALEEARGDYDGESVVEAIVDALGRIDEADARAALARRLERLAAGEPARGDVSSVAHALWRRRHPDLLPVVRRSLAHMAPPASRALLGLLVLLEETPEGLCTWVCDPRVPLEQKTGVVTVLEVDPPPALLSTLPAFISVAQSLADTAVRQQGEHSYYCERLLSLLLLHKEQVLPALPEAARAELRSLLLKLVTSVAPNCSFRAGLLLQFVGRPEDAVVIEAHRPADPSGAKAFDEAARALRRGSSRSS